MKRVFLIVLDSFGVGALPDSAAFGDAGSNTLASCATSPLLQIPTMTAAGLGAIDGVTCLPRPARPLGAYGRLQEASMGKDTTIGHWEIAGVVSPEPMPTYPHGFPEEVLAPFRAATGRGTLCNIPISGTEAIARYGDEHVRTGDLIVYTSADSVFQIAAHEAVVPPEELYRICRIARGQLTGKHGVGRVIARPFEGEWPFRRTTNRHDFSLTPPRTMLNAISEAGQTVLSVGKINDIFAGSGVTESHPTRGNTDGLRQTLALADRDFRGLCFVNLVDFDMLYGHRQDPDGYAAALAEFDRWLPGFLEKLGPEDAVLITADHGCDPSDQSTDHTREYVPLLALGQQIRPGNLGTRETFADVAATVCALLDVPWDGAGTAMELR